MLRLLNKAIEVAKTSPGVGRNNNYRVGAVLFDKRGRVLTAKANSYKTHPKLLPFTKWPFLHAESSCLISHGLDRVADLSILVTRVTARGHLTMASPCNSCRSLLKHSGIKSVYFTDWKGNLECQQL